MLPSPTEPHVYNRHISANERSSLSVLASLIGPGAKVLDLGCGSGALGQWLTTHAHCQVDGLTLSDQEASLAAPHYRRVEVGNLETTDLTALFAPGGYQAVVCADVLEHLSQPERILKACHTLLAPDGELLISIPNAAYCGLLAELLAGRFDYRTEGLLDRTHLRFFTRSTLLEFLAQHGWTALHVEAVRRDIADSEFNVAIDALPPAVARYLLSGPDALTYQLIVRCQRSGLVNGVPTTTPPPAANPAQAHFTAELFLGSASGYSQANKLTARGTIGLARQTMGFHLPANDTPWSSLRLDPADRAGFLHLHAIRLLDHQGQVLWQWDSAAPPLPQTSPWRQHQIHWQTQGALSASPLLLLLGDDPWLELPVPPEALAQASMGHARLDIELGWPMSADYLCATHAVATLTEQTHQLRDQLAQLHHRMQADAHAATLRQTELTDEVAQHRHRAAAVQLALEQLQAQHDDLRQERDTLTQAQQQLRQHQQDTQDALDKLSAHLRWIENSTVFKVTRPLVHLKMAVDRALSFRPVAQATAQPTALTPPPHPVDVIVPVYKGLFDTQRCITSALASGCDTPFRLIVINDASPEPDVTDWLRHIATTDSRVLLLENPDNLGFVGTVNRGMSHSQHNDVLLLNSDTEVANNWLDRLRATAYGDAKVGTVTPFSNNATICSYPKFCAANALPPGHTTASLDHAFAQANAGASVDVPTGVGFCMYIRRDCLDSVGLFDVTNFGKGYGEENDFCCRAQAKGWRNLHALDTFVLHAGGVSFGDSKNARELAAMETLRRLHPRYEAEVMQFVQDDPAQPYRHAVDLIRLVHSPLPKVLAVTHDRAGGTLRHVKELAQTLSGQAQCLVLSPLPGGRAALALLGEGEAFQLDFAMDSEFDDLVLLLRSVNVSLVHFHHLLGHHPRVQSLPKQLGVPYDFTAHDHYTHCPQISLTNATNRYCGELGEAQCRQCLQHSPAPGGVDIGTWRANHQQFLRGTRFVLAPSQDTALRMQRFVPQAQVRLAPHTDLTTSPPAPIPRRMATGTPLKVVVIGALSSIKGADVLEEVATLAAQTKAPIEFHLVGYAYRSLKTRPRSHLTVHGEYTEAELPGMLEWLQPDLVWFPALWPETYSYTLSACLQAGLPVVAPNLGAFPERLSGRTWTWVMPWDTATADWLQFFAHIHLNHFATGTPPPQQPPSSTVSTPTWDYSQHYLPATHVTEPDRAPMPSIAWLHAHRPGKTQPGLQAITTSARGHALSMLLRLRSAPGLRSVAKAIPLRWQTRVKSWLAR